MKKSDFFFDLPHELIAQTPSKQRDASRLLCLDRNTGALEHKHFYDVLDMLNEGDCLILNDSRVIPARIFGVKKDTGAIVEFLLLKQRGNNIWEVLTKPGKKAKIGTEFVFGDGKLIGRVTDIVEEGNRIVEFEHNAQSIFEILEEIGNMPLPPYITEKLEDKERYQTVYSRELGSAAAPTAGLHFTTELMDKIRAKGVSIGFVTLHVGLGTFRPVKEEEITNHVMHSEHYTLSEETARLINKTKAAGKRVIAVGTTSCRTLESAATKKGEPIKASEAWTSIFIYPGYEFKVIDGLITNFHLPESTLIMLVSAFAGYEHTMQAYSEAVNEKYRFFSFGDAMIIL